MTRDSREHTFLPKGGRNRLKVAGGQGPDRREAKGKRGGECKRGGEGEEEGGEEGKRYRECVRGEMEKRAFLSVQRRKEGREKGALLSSHNEFLSPSLSLRANLSVLNRFDPLLFLAFFGRVQTIVQNYYIIIALFSHASARTHTTGSFIISDTHRCTYP